VGCWSSRFAEGSRVSVFTDTGVYRGSVLPLMASGHAFNTAIDQMPISWEHVEVRRLLHHPRRLRSAGHSHR
jgi:putative aminopeptidase FrvX